MKKISGIVLLGAAALTLAACSNQSSSNAKKVTSSNDSEMSSSSVSRGHLSANNLSPKKNVAVITAYAASNYGENWTKTLNRAKDEGLHISLENKDADDSIKGNSYIYGVDYEKTFYTLSGDGASQIIYFYDDGEYLGSKTVSQIVNYLNDHNSDELVNEIAAKVTIGEDSDDSASDDNDSSSGSKDIPGDGGLYTVSSKMIGTWYSTDGDIKFTKDTFTNSDGTFELHTQKSQPEDSSGSILDQTKDILAVSPYSVSGMKGIVFSGWVQKAGAKMAYIMHTEEGHPVILELSTAKGLETIYWPSKALADKYADTSFDDLESIGG